MKPDQYSLLDIQKAIVLAQRQGECLLNIRITNQMRSTILQLITSHYTTKYNDIMVTFSVAASVVRKSISRYLVACGVIDTTYITTLATIFINQLKTGVTVYYD